MGIHGPDYVAHDVFYQVNLVLPRGQVIQLRDDDVPKGFYDMMEREGAEFTALWLRELFGLTVTIAVDEKATARIEDMEKPT